PPRRDPPITEPTTTALPATDRLRQLQEYSDLQERAIAAAAKTSASYDALIDYVNSGKWDKQLATILPGRWQVRLTATSGAPLASSERFLRGGFTGDNVVTWAFTVDTSGVVESKRTDVLEDFGTLNLPEVFASPVCKWAVEAPNVLRLTFSGDDVARWRRRSYTFTFDKVDQTELEGTTDFCAALFELPLSAAQSPSSLPLQSTWIRE